MSQIAERDHRELLLRKLGASTSATEELLEYTKNPFRERLASFDGQLPLPDEEHLEAWRAYLEAAEAVGAFEALRERLVQLRFPIQKGISQSREYLAATRKGDLSELSIDGAGLALREPDRLELVLHPTPAGTIPILIAEEREDFVSLVRAFSARNEPVTVPNSMGACIVKGLNNWDRIHALRRRWEASKGGGASSWQDEFRKIIPRKELYQDRFVVLSRGPYSGVPSASFGLPEETWLERSLVIRRDHECTHYFTLRVLGAMRNNLHDELIADFVGLVGAFGEYRSEPALLFLGLEDHPDVRADGRFHNYRGDPPLSEEAFGILKQLVVASIHNLARFDATRGSGGQSSADLAAVILALASTTLEELATERIVERLQSQVHRRRGE